MPVTRVPMCDLIICGEAGELAVGKLLPDITEFDRDGRLADESGRRIRKYSPSVTRGHN